MTTPKFTPGQWFAGHMVNPKHLCKCRYISSDNHMGSIAEISDGNDKEGDNPPEEEAVANALLIAAAPDLYHALTQCEAQFRFYADEYTKAGKTEKAATNTKFADLARAALKKATTP